jgi:hypothetical protein
MNTLIRSRPLLSPILLAGLLICQQSPASDDGIEGTEQLFGTWANVMVSGRFGEKSPWIYYGDVSLRTTEQARPFPPEGQGYQVSSVVTHDAVGYQFNANHSVHVGYAFAYAIPPLAKEPTNENRAWEQYTFALPTTTGDLQLRSRLEQRTVNIGSGTAVRFRQMLKFVHPLNKEWSLVGSDELFINANTVDWGPVSGFDQNRVFVGIGYKFAPALRAEVGYMNQYISRDLNYDRDFHLLSLNLYVDVPE